MTWTDYFTVQHPVDTWQFADIIRKEMGLEVSELGVELDTEKRRWGGAPRHVLIGCFNPDNGLYAMRVPSVTRVAFPKVLKQNTD